MDSNALWKKVTATIKPLHAVLTTDEVVQSPRATKSLSTGLYQAPMPLRKSPGTLDLHGLTVDDAYRATVEFIRDSGGRSSLTIITGKSGQIKQEFPRWVEGIPKVHSITAKCDGGAYTVRVLKKFRSPSR